MKAITILAAGVAGLALVAATASAQGRGQGAQATSTATTGDRVRAALPPSEPVFSTKEISIITAWFRDNRRQLPPGLAKKEALPPGIEKQLKKNGKLPPGLEKKLHPIPAALEKQLVVLPSGYRRVVIGGNVIIMNPVTGLIYDIIREVIP